MPPLGSKHPAWTRLRMLARRGRERERSALGVAEGPKLVEAALDAGASVEEVFVGSAWSERGDGRAWRTRLERECPAPVHEVVDARLRAALDASTPAPLAAVVAWRPADAAIDPSVRDDGAPGWWLVACGLQDPGNLGTLWRTAEAAGAAGLVRVGPGAGLRHPRTWRASMGSCFRLPAWDVDAADLRRFGEDRRWTAVAADPHRGESYATFDWPDRAALLLGSEARGLPAEALDDVDRRVTVPLSGGVESLSVGAAAAVLSFACAASRR